MPRILFAYLRLLRPANIVTAVADIAAGITITGVLARGRGHELAGAVLLLAFSTACLYGGGVVLNDAFDADLDRVERPERPIPSGIVPERNAFLFGFLLLALGTAAAFLVHFLAGWIAVAIALAAVLYDKWAKHHPLLGPFNMGLCRGLNLLLGMSIFPFFVSAAWYLAVVPVVYIAAITTVSRGEVHGGGRPSLYAAAAMYAAVIGALAYVAQAHDQLLYALPFLLLFAFLIFRPLAKAVREPVGSNIGKAVKGGVIALIVLNAAWAAAFGYPVAGVCILLLLPLSFALARAFAVT